MTALSGRRTRSSGAPRPAAGQRSTVDFERLVRDLAALGLPAGASVLINCSLRRLGFLYGGPSALLRAIQRLIGPHGTIVVPTQTANNSTTSRYHLAAVTGMTGAERQRYIDSLPGFDRDASPSFGMGMFAEWVRKHPRAVRSDHPQTSFAALGPSARRMMAGHRLRSHLGDKSPLAALYEAGGFTLLLGVGYDKCTTLHLAEYRLPPGIEVPIKEYRCFVARGGRRETRVFRAVDLDDRCFPDLGKELDSQPFVRSGPVGHAKARLIPIRAAVDYAIGWITERRKRAGR